MTRFPSTEARGRRRKGRLTLDDLNHTTESRLRQGLAVEHVEEDVQALLHVVHHLGLLGLGGHLEVRNLDLGTKECDKGRTGVICRSLRSSFDRTT